MDRIKKILLSVENGVKHHCQNGMVEWWQLALGAIFLFTAVAILQSQRVPYPMTISYLFPSATMSSHKPLNATDLVNESLPSHEGLKGFPSVSVAPVGLINSTLRNVSISDVPHEEELDKDKPNKVVNERFSDQSIASVSSVNSSISNASSADEISHEGNVTHDKEDKAVLDQFMNESIASVRLVNSSVSNVSTVNVQVTYGGLHEENLNYPSNVTLEEEKINSKMVAVQPPETVFANEREEPKTLVQPPPSVPASVEDAQSHTENPEWLLSPQQALVYAKREIENAPIVVRESVLYACLFRNVSVFKRSYDLMENILKVYIYKDGKRPIFHTPELKGIYASEGWFMKLMEDNKQFVVEDPEKAHLFYLPYSARQLELTLYVRNSHDMQPLRIFLRDYINMISAKYPFWNRTRGSDHFFVACHDWGPYTTVEHEQLRNNTIKAVCNADASEGIFVRGKDVSLPETMIRNPKRPLKDIGGKPISQRTILAFYAGHLHGRVRPILLKYWGGKDEDMKIYGPLPRRVMKKMSYVQHMKSSKFCICPMGYEVNSPRIVEAIYYECVPVIIADNFVLPFEEVLDWSAFSVVVAEKDIPKLKEILLAISLRRYITMQTNVKQLKKHFLWHNKPIKYDLFHMILHSVWFNRLNRKQIQEQ